MNQLIHTPAGVRDVFGTELERKNLLRDKIRKIFLSYGYNFIETPAIEFFPVFDKDKGTLHSSQLYKIIDKDGHTLVLRPDYTPSIARAVSMYYSEEDLPLRLCYNGNVYLSGKVYRGRLNESTEMGVELINFDKPEADAELIAMQCSIMKEAGFADFQICIGNVAYFYALCKEGCLSDDDIATLRSLFSARNHFGAMEYIDSLDIKENVKQALNSLPVLFGGTDILEKASSVTDNTDALDAIGRLKAVYELVCRFGFSQYVSFDLSMLSDYTYYTGIIFQTVTYGSGDAVIQGGRYNSFIEKFGKRANASGFTTKIDALISALQRQDRQFFIPNDKIMILYRSDLVEEAIQEAKSCRSTGLNVFCIPFDDPGGLDAYKAYAKKHSCGTVIFIKNPKEKETIWL